MVKKELGPDLGLPGPDEGEGRVCPGTPDWVPWAQSLTGCGTSDESRNSWASFLICKLKEGAAAGGVCWGPRLHALLVGALGPWIVPSGDRRNRRKNNTHCGNCNLQKHLKPKLRELGFTS